MTEAQKLQKELDAMAAKRIRVKKALTAKDDLPTIKRTYKYKKSGAF